MAKRNARRNRRARRARQQGQGGVVRAPVAVAGPSTSQANTSLRATGVDRVAHVDDVSTSKTGDIVVQFAILPGIAERLSKYSALFTRVRYMTLRFEIRSQCSTASSGGYVAAFVRDPDEILPTTNVLQMLAGQAGSKAANWWQSLVVVVPPTPDLFYTDEGHITEGTSKRLLSPGKLVIACDGPASVAGSLTVNLIWTATFLEPALELQPIESKSEITLEKHYAFWDFGNSLEQTYVTALMNPGTTRYLTPTDLGIRSGTIWRTRPYTFMGEGPTDNFYKVVTTQYVVVVDSTDGYIRPAVMAEVAGKGPWRIVDATESFGTFSYYEAGPAIGGQTPVFYAGDVWVEVDASGEPIDSSGLSVSAHEHLVSIGMLISSKPVVKVPRPTTTTQGPTTSTLPPALGVRAKRDVTALQQSLGLTPDLTGYGSGEA
jgi:hypothetical protein